MNNELGKTPEAEPDYSRKADKSKSFLDEKEEFQLLLKGIEENSKHARSVMFALVLACVYVLLAAFSSPVLDNQGSATPLSSAIENIQRSIELPVIKVNVKDSQFFFFSPLVILLAYLYLHIYIRELRARLKSIEPYLKKYENSGFDSGHLLFPWIVVFAFQSQCKNQKKWVPEKGKRFLAKTSYEERMFGRDFLVRAIASILLWVLGPVVLIVLWALFIGQRDPVSIIPCISFILAVCTARYTAIGNIGKSARILLSVLGLALIVFTVSSVPGLSSPLGINVFWTSINNAWLKITDINISWWLSVAINILVIQLLPIIIWLILLPFGKLTLRVRDLLAVRLSIYTKNFPSQLIPYSRLFFLISYFLMGRTGVILEAYKRLGMKYGSQL